MQQSGYPYKFIYLSLLQFNYYELHQDNSHCELRIEILKF
jgi:hypothetical protein